MLVTMRPRRRPSMRMDGECALPRRRALRQLDGPLVRIARRVHSAGRLTSVCVDSLGGGLNAPSRVHPCPLC
eukprot:scaffold297552_cov30-Tisochrysis_lutea.AAC.2